MTSALPLKTARKIKGLTQRELADRAGVDHSFLCRLESGERDIRSAGLEMAARIAWALGLTVGELWPLTFTDEPRVEPVEPDPADATPVAVGGRS